jgi:hypothetical protein
MTLEFRYPDRMLDGEEALFRIGSVDVTVMPDGQHWFTSHAISCDVYDIVHSKPDWHVIRASLTDAEADQIVAMASLWGE